MASHLIRRSDRHMETPGWEPVGVSAGTKGNPPGSRSTRTDPGAVMTPRVIGDRQCIESPGGWGSIAGEPGKWEKAGRLFAQGILHHGVRSTDSEARIAGPRTTITNARRVGNRTPANEARHNGVHDGRDDRDRTMAAGGVVTAAAALGLGGCNGNNNNRADMNRALQDRNNQAAKAENDSLEQPESAVAGCAQRSRPGCSMTELPHRRASRRETPMHRAVRRTQQPVPEVRRDGPGDRPRCGSSPPRPDMPRVRLGCGFSLQERPDLRVGLTSSATRPARPLTQLASILNRGRGRVRPADRRPHRRAAHQRRDRTATTARTCTSRPTAPSACATCSSARFGRR